MGQTTVGVLFGAQVPESVELYNDAGDGLIERWERSVKRDRKLVPRWPDDSDVIGMFVAIGAGGAEDYGCASLDAAIPLDDFATAKPYAAAYKRAAKRWDAFAAWCATQGTVLPPARLWLALTEVA